LFCGMKGHGPACCTIPTRVKWRTRLHMNGTASALNSLIDADTIDEIMVFVRETC